MPTLKVVPYVLLLGSCATDTPIPDQPVRTVILTGVAAHALLEPCTRTPPAPADSLWTPGGSAVLRLTRHVDLVLGSQAPDGHGFGPLPLDEYVMGVAGFYRGGRKWLYGSFAARDLAVDAAPELWPNWCDGSWKLFGVDYDVEADTIGPLHPNEGVYAQ